MKRWLREHRPKNLWIRHVAIAVAVARASGRQRRPPGRRPVRSKPPRASIRPQVGEDADTARPEARATKRNLAKEIYKF